MRFCVPCFCVVWYFLGVGINSFTSFRCGSHHVPTWLGPVCPVCGMSTKNYELVESVSWVSCDPSLSHSTPGGLVPSDRSVAAERVLFGSNRELGVGAIWIMWLWPPYPHLCLQEHQASLSNHAWNAACHLGYFCCLSLSNCSSNSLTHGMFFFSFPRLPFFPDPSLSLSLPEACGLNF